MNQVVLALLPGIGMLAWFFGVGIVINLVVAVAAAVATEIVILHLRGHSLATLLDGSAVVTGILIGICLPPFIPVWVIVAGVVFAMIFGKHLYGGLGHNPFNPAMVGYAMMIVSFPLAMSLWPAPLTNPDALSVMAYKMGIPIADGITAATPLDAFKFRGATTVGEFVAGSAVMHRVGGMSVGIGWQWVNAGFLAGGIYLVYRGVCGWLMPAIMLLTLTILALVFYDSGSSQSLGSPAFHLFSGATMLGAFFILTDPVTSPDSQEGQIVFAMGVGALTFVIRNIGAYPEGLAFAILLMNTATPFIDQIRWRYA